MMPVIFSVGPFSISPFGFFVAIAFVISSYLLWRELREDYVEEKILTFTLLVSTSVLLGSRIFYYLSHLYLAGPNIFKILDLRGFPGNSFLGAVLGATGMIIYFSRREKWDLWVVFDEMIKMFFIFLTFSNLGLYLSNRDLFTLILAAVSLIFGAISYFLTKYYRRFIWYKSGKPGFVSLLMFAIFVFFYLILDFFLKRGIVWEGAGFFVLSLYALAIIYYRSGRSLKEDLRFFVKFKKP